MSDVATFAAALRSSPTAEESISKYLAALDCRVGKYHQASRLTSQVFMQLHWGGGTPTHLTIEEIERLFRQITDHFTILPDAEVAIEVDPRVTTAGAYRETA